MKRLLPLLLSALLMLTACAEGSVSCPAGNTAAEETGNTANEQLKSEWAVNDDITISLAQDTYPLGTEAFEITLTNSGSQTMLYGEGFSFEYHNNGIWEPLKTIDNYGFHSIGYLLAPGDIQTLTLGTWMLKEPLQEGLYRIIGCDLWVADNAEDLHYMGQYTEYLPYELEFRISAEAGIHTVSHQEPVSPSPFRLDITPPSPGSDQLEFSIINESGTDAEILLIPTLEYINEFGNWEVVLFRENVGFCGTPDPLPPGSKDWSVELTTLWDELADGEYRLGYTVTDSNGSEHTVWGQFTFDDGLCSLPLANSGS